MTTPKFPKSQKWQDAEIQSYKLIFELIAALEKRIQQLEVWKKRKSREI